MSRVAWPNLMDLGMRQLGLQPDLFWDLTPAELMFLAGADATGGACLTRTGLDALMAKYPDRGEGDA
ncbi:rcc01693 family protein [Algicella marina]|uniref:Phage tail assembly chaperone n=1 Tax=Algicella marina TaxID=2683284 RepID=A0A6P1SVS9_9RHOB|nr:rcc01693 family protein [Algicella marina]QHQ34558.1 phage tail assembly chaperone [Algicella marina]